MRFYTSSRSYPELREIESFWSRQKLWFRALLRSLRDWRMWLFLASNAVVFVGANVAVAVIGPTVYVGGQNTTPWRVPAQAALLLGAMMFFATSSLSWGGAIVRPHFRRVSRRCRESCPLCGHNLAIQLSRRGDDADAPVRCPECGEMIAAVAFREPFRLP